MLLENSQREVIEEYLSIWMSKDRASWHKALSGVRFTNITPEIRRLRPEGGGVFFEPRFRCNEEKQAD